VSALAVDPSGARVLTGSHDYDVKLWDFGGMDARFKPFRSWEPAESYHVGLSIYPMFFVVLTKPQVHDLKYSNAGDKFLVISGTSQAKLYERDGEEVYV
jgi:WD40 repeat protein